MFGTRQVLTPARGRSILALSAVALLALCLLPVGAQAASAGYQYSDAPPTSTGAPSSESNLQGGSPTKGGGGSGGGANGGKHGGAGGGANGSSATGGGGANGSGQTGQGSGGETGVGGGQSLPGAEPGSDSGGSSPLVPILIAIVLLAGGSVAYLMIKRRRAAGATGAPGKPGKAPGASPEAG